MEVASDALDCVFLRSRVPGDFCSRYPNPDSRGEGRRTCAHWRSDRFDRPRYLEALRSCGAAVPALLIPCAVATLGAQISRSIRCSRSRAGGLRAQLERSTALIVTDANEVVEKMHDRMLVIIQAKDYDRRLMPDRFGGSIPTPSAASAVTNSLRQATRWAFSLERKPRQASYRRAGQHPRRMLLRQQGCVS
jgi:hypothetical protein